jgi:hypothetical protein
MWPSKIYFPEFCYLQSLGPERLTIDITVVKQRFFYSIHSSTTTI